MSHASSCVKSATAKGSGATRKLHSDYKSNLEACPVPAASAVKTFRRSIAAGSATPGSAAGGSGSAGTRGRHIGCPYRYGVPRDLAELSEPEELGPADLKFASGTRIADEANWSYESACGMRRTDRRYCERKQAVRPSASAGQARPCDTG